MSRSKLSWGQKLGVVCLSLFLVSCLLYSPRVSRTIRRVKRLLGGKTTPSLAGMRLRNDLTVDLLLELPAPSGAYDGKIRSPDISGLAFSPDGKKLATIGYGSFSFQVWDLETGDTLARKFLPSRPLAVFFSPTGDQVWGFTIMHEVFSYPLARAEDPPIAIIPQFGTPSEAEKSGPDPYRYHFIHAAINASGTEAVLAAYDGDSLIWDCGQQRIVPEIRLRRGRRAGFSPDGQSVVIGEGAWFDRVDLSTRAKTSYRITLGNPDQLLDLAFSPRGSYLGTIHNDTTITIWNAREMKELHNFFISSSCAWTCSFSRDERLFATTHSDRGLLIWDTTTSARMCFYPQPGALIVAFSPVADQLALGFEDGHIELLSYVLTSQKSGKN